jgi:hypothetical protein
MTNQKCQWRSGKKVADNTEFVVDGDLFEVNFCHPPSTMNWNVTAPECVSSTGKQACDQLKNCDWSTAKEFIEKDSHFSGRQEFCALAKVSMIAEDYASCGRNETDCVAPCKWFSLGDDNNTTPAVGAEQCLTTD